MSKWRKDTFKVTLSNPNEDPTKAGMIHACGFFAIANGANDVTHIPTGLKINRTGHFSKSRKLARNYAEQLAGLSVDWAQITNDNLITEKCGERLLRDVIREILDQQSKPTKGTK